MKIENLKIETSKNSMKIENLKFKIVLSLLFALSFLLSASPAFADDLSVGIFPPIIQINATIPADIKSPITIQNFTNNALDLNVLFRSFKSSSTENGQVQFLPSGTVTGEDKDIFQKIEILNGSSALSRITLSPKQTKKLTLHIRLPKDEPASEYYFSILFVSKSETTSGQNLAQASGGIASNVLLSIGPNGPTTGSISEFSTSSFVSHGPVPFAIKVKNTSPHFVTIKGNLVIKNIFGQIVGNINLLPVNVLANSQRQIPSKDSVSNIDDERIFWSEKILLGFYNADLTIALSDQGPILRKHLSFFAFPIEGLIGLIISIVIVVIARKRMSEKA